MKPIRIDITKLSFNDEYHADIVLDHNIIKYISSDSLDGLLQAIHAIVIRHRVD